MSWKVHETDEVFAGLRGMCSNAYRMYDPCEYRYYYDHDCDVYECAVEDAAEEYERLLKHCEKQREELAAIKNPLGRLKEAFMDNIDGGTEVERIEGASKVRAGSSITDELMAVAARTECANGRCEKLYRGDLERIADRIDERYHRDMATAQQVGYNEGEDAAMRDGWVKLPVDADGVLIRVGDEMEDGENLPARVRALMLTVDGWWCKSGIESILVAPSYLRHVQPDSWIRIIGDAMSFDGDGWYSTRDDAMAELVERCRRLAGEAE